MLILSELRKLSSTKMPWIFLFVLIFFAVINAIAVIAGTDMDGSKTFISTAADQQSLVAFANNAMLLAALFGAIAAAREYSHKTVVPTFLTSPRRYIAVIAQQIAVFLGGALIGFVGTTLITVAVMIALTSTEYDFLISNSSTFQVIAGSSFVGAAGAVLGAGIGSIIRNTGGAVTGTFLILVIIPPLIVQLASTVAAWIPSSLANVISGIASDTSVFGAVLAIAIWAIIPAIAGIMTTEHRDVI